MTTLVRHRQKLPQRARDWAEIQERMLVPLYEAVYRHVEIGPGSRVLDLGCGSGLALLLAAGRGASVTGVEADGARLALARERLLPDPEWGVERWDAQLTSEAPEYGSDGDAPQPDVVTAFDALGHAESVASTAPALEPGTRVVLAGWGPPERCAAAPVLRLAAQLTDRTAESWEPCGRDDLEELALDSGLRLDGSGRVACPFGYAGVDSAVRGLLSTGLYDAALQLTDRDQVVNELTGALHPYLQPDGTVWMPNLFRYVVARAG